ncbi:SDR family NAD(P)-dependent oxidoreductase [Catalinimonas niigatensis]|uniref:SDR family NAD(P)-dependent oxidoreductase n=1 Tax=Catalinimonas niigatensis TaxID=1397264 RepID=UPI002666E7A9|nr:SDR family NAD(P)-dependent oxidoreductase [Catalinimonas niigatensis]WPP49728.1 SDR family NAD(P)-dependent oxidoreductase [Catalinimonas niigatensis]
MHARNKKRAKDAIEDLPAAKDVLMGDLANMEEVKQLAEDVNALGTFDAVIHNAGIYRGSGQDLFNVNLLAPYILTSLIDMPERLIYLSSDMHRGGTPLSRVTDPKKATYSDSKLYVTTLMNAVARLFPDIYVNAVDPGWVPTKMGGEGAPGDLQKGYQTQTWLAVSQDKEALVSGGYFYHQQQQSPRSETKDIELQEQLLQVCEQITGVIFP